MGLIYYNPSKVWNHFQVFDTGYYISTTHNILLYISDSDGHRVCVAQCDKHLDCGHMCTQACVSCSIIDEATQWVYNTLYETAICYCLQF